MALVRAKHARSSDYIYSKKRASLSIFVSTVLLVTTVSPASLALNANNSNVAIPALCDPTTLPITISPSPAVSTSTPQPEVSATPEIVPIPNPSEVVEPVAELISEDYVEPVIPAGESSATVSKSEPPTSPKVICPSPVTNIIARPQNTQLEISWSPGISAEANTVENITDYYIKVLETSQVIKVSSDKTSTTISGLTNGTSYSIIVYAASEYGSSVASDLVAAIPLSGNEGEVAGIIVAFKPEANVEQGQLDVPGEELVSQVELTIENKITEDVHVVEFSEATTLEEAKTIANEISQDPQVVWAEPDQFVYTSSTEVINDPNYSTDQWNLWDKYGIGIGQTNKEMTTAWSLTAGQGINVAVIDTGITSHPDLDSQVIKGFDFVSDPEFLKATREENGSQVSFDGDYINSEKYGSLGWDDNPQDPGDWRGVGPVRNSTWHGTHIAGVIAAQSENQEGIAGIAPGAKIQPIRALSWRGGLLSDIASSITWASGGSVTGVADNPTPAKVINMSFSVNSICPTSLQTAINDAFARGSVLVAAAGNNNDDVKNYAPANCENVISVGASNKDGKRASYSNYGLGIDVSAPGGDANDNGIYSTSNAGLAEPASFGYASQQGTSISAAHVSAIAARIFSTNPAFNPTDVKTQITSKESVREFADTQCDINADVYCGEGIVSLFQIASSPVTSNLVLNLNASIPGINKGTTYNGTTWFDQSGNSRNATAVNSPTYNSSDGSFTLNGTNQYFNLGNILSFTSAFSIEVTFTPNSITGSPMLVTRQNTGVTGNYYLGITNSKALYGVNSTPWSINSTSTLSVGTKYTATLVYDINKDITPYLDGVQNGTKTNYPTALAERTIDLLIGAGLTNSAASNFFSGKIHSVRIYNKALSSSEVLQSYNSKTCSPTSQTASGYTTLTFTNSEPCNWSVPVGVTAADVLGVGGGGGGGAGVNGGAGGNEGGGGGGGGVIETLGISVSGSYPIVIGAGGAINQNGTGSSALGVSVSGGGAGGTVFGNGSAGASGGGGTHNRTSGGTGIAGQGFAGGTPPEASRGGGGGGAGEAGNTDGDAHGGDGKVSAITGSTFGGGGTGARNGAGALGGEGGGGVSTQTFNGSLIAASNGSANTGGGGAGGFTNNATPNAGSGGSGIVVIRYVNATCEPTTSPSPPSGYTVLTFTNTTACSWSIPAGVTAADVLVVGGGGAGGGGIGGGGGAGEFIETTRTGLTGGSSVLISVGAGGSPNSSAAGNIGGDSRFDSVIAYGGGGGGTNNANPSVASGGPNLGSQGGGGYENSARTVGSRSDGITGFRNNGGSGSLGGSGNATAGGGGGAGGAGGAGTTSSGSPAQSGGAGGAGKSSSISGVSTFYAGGGGGGVNGASETANGSTPASSGSPGVGGSSIGGSGGAKTNAASSGNFGNRGDGTGGTVNANGTAGVANTGSGGGGASNWVLGGAGGSGIVIVKYAKLTPTLSSISNVSKTYGDSTFSISAPTATFSSSTIAGSVSYSSSNTSVASISESTATVVGVGTATFTATFTPTDTSLYNSTTTTFTITVAAKTLTITAEAKSKSFGETTPTNSYTLSTTLVGSDAISSLTYTYSGTNSITSPTAVGSYTITPSSVVFSTGSASNYSITYTAGSYTINKATPTLSSISNVSKTYGDSTFSITDPTATFSGSTIAGSVSYSSSNTSVASVSGSTVTVVGVGTATVTATFTPSSTSSYNSTTTTFTITVAAKTLTITAEAKSKSFGATTPTNSYTLSTTLVGSDAISSLTYTYSGTNSITAPTAVGSYTITPSSVVFSTGSASNYSITYAAGSYTINKANQSALTFTSASSVTYGNTLTLEATGGSSTGAITYAVSSGTCTISSSTLTPGNAGSSCVITATKAADTNYNAVSTSTQTITINKANQSALTISSTSGIFGSALTLTTSGGTTAGSVLYSVTTGTASTCTESGGSLTAGSAGTCLVTATMAGSGSYETVSSSQTTITFAQASQSTLTVSSTSGTFGSALTLTASGGSGNGSVTYAATTGTASSCTVSGTSLTAGSAGTCLVTATKAADTNYSAVSSTQTTVTFAQAAQSTLTVSSTSGTFGTALTLTTSGGSGTGSITYAATTGTASSCTVSGTSLTAGSAGTCLVTATKASSTNYLSASSVQTTVTFAKANQSSLSMSSASSVTYGNTLSLESTGGSSTGSTSYAVSSGTCTISGSTLTPGDAGSTCIITATKAADTNYNSVSSSTQTITINKASQSALTIDSAATVAFGSTLTLSTTGGSGTGSVTYSKTGTCTISGSTLTPGDAGSSCVVTATKALDTNYNAISSATQTITITKINQSALTISSTSGTFGSALTLTTSGGTTAGSVTYSVSDGTASTCAISTGSLSVASAGTCLVTATMAGNTNYNAVVSTQTTITFAKASQSSLTVTSTSGTYGSALTLTTSGGSGDGAVTFVATPGTASSCTVSGSTLTAGSGGTCLVTATKATSTNYLAVSSSQTTVSFGNQAVSLSGFSDISSKNYGDTTFTLTAPTVAGSVAGAFTYSSGTTSVATISSSTVTIIGAGTSTITATFTPTDTGRYSSQTITMLLTVNKKAITITAVDKTKVYAQSTPTNSFTNSTLVGSDAISSLTYTYSGTNSTSAPTTVGNYTITPSSASFSTGSINNYTITYVPAAYSITKATPAFTGFNNVSKTYGDSSFTITAPTVTGSISGSFAYSSSDTSAITISSATATVAGTGSSLITASFTPTDTTNYNSATTTMTISVAKATQSSLSITSASSVNYGSTISLTSSGGSGTGAISFAVTSGTCSISSTTLTPGNAGSTCVIQATKALDTNYNVATSSTQTITINKINQTVSFTSTAPSSPVSGDTYTPLASATSGAIPTISIASSSSSICSLSAGIVTFNTSGTCLIEADSASSTNYNAATTASQSITVAKIAQTITFNQPSASSFGDSSRSMSASASSGLAITYSLGASTTNTACSVSSSGVVTILAVGNCEVTAAQSGNSQYDSALSVSRTFAVNAIVPSAPFLTSVSAGNTNATVSFTAPSSNGGANLSAYEIVAMPTSGSNITKSNCSTSASPLACTITGLINGVSYTFKVAAVNSAGTGAYSTTSGSFTPATIANSVVNLVAQPGDGTLVVNWDQPTNLGGGSFTRYDVYYKSTGSYPGTPNAQINSVSTTTTTFSGLTNGTSYDVKVVAITSANASELAGNTAEVSQYPSTVASAPTNVAAAKLTATSARISWGLPLTDGGASLDATTPYVVTITGGPSAITCGTLSGRTCDISGLYPSSTYSISVKAQNRMGLGTAGTTTYLVPSNDANLLSLDLKTGATLSDPSNATYSPSFDAATTSYSISVANTQAYARITPTVNEATATIKINGIAVVSGVARNLSLGIGSNVFTVEITAGDLATTKTYTLTVTRPKASQMPISITSANSVNYGSTITLSTSGGSGNGLMAFTTTGTCTTSFSGGSYVLTPGDVGSSCSIVATKATDDDYFAASSTSQTITINKTTPTLSDFTNISKTYGDPSFTINEPNVSGNAPGTFTYSSSNTSAITVSGSTITVAGNGSATITATFTPTSSTNYNSATTSLVITVAKKALRVTPANKTKFYGASHPTITNSVIGLAGSEDISTISYSYLGTGSTTYSASTTNPTDAGTYSMTPVITALTTGSLSNYEITYDSADFTISKVNQSALSITSSTSATFGSTLTLTTSGGSGTGAITFTKVSGDCTLNTSGSTYSITPGDAGNNCVVNASRAADTNYNLVSTSDQTITIGKANQSLSFTSSASSLKVNETYTPVVTSTHSSTGVATSITPSVTIDSASAAICSISSGIVTFNAEGSCVINADAVSSTNYNSATTDSQTLTITVVTTTSAPSSSAGSNTPTPTPSPSSGVRPNATRPIIRNVVERPAPEVVPNLPQLNNPALRPVFPSRNLPTIPNNFDTGLAITDNLGRLPLSEPGEKQIKVGNEFVPVIESVSPQGALTLTIPETINVSPIEVSIQTTDIKGQNIPAPDDGIIRAVKGQTITVSGDGLTPGSTYSVWLFSEPTKLGEGKVSGDATFNKVFLVPDQLATGSHTLQINGINSDQKVVSLTTGVILTEVKEIQNVGDSNSDLIAYAILFIFFLLLIIAILLRYIRKQQLKYLV